MANPKNHPKAAVIQARRAGKTNSQVFREAAEEIEALEQAHHQVGEAKFASFLGKRAGQVEKITHPINDGKKAIGRTQGKKLNRTSFGT
ncbi:MAG: hypothetical protein V4490_03010 [Pseudomonadota bacterium]